MEKKIILVDNAFGLSVAEDKALLVREVLKHYAPRWAKEAENVPDTAEYLKEKIPVMLKKLSVEHEVVEIGDTVTIISPQPETLKAE